MPPHRELNGAVNVKVCGGISLTLGTVNLIRISMPTESCELWWAIKSSHEPCKHTEAPATPEIVSPEKPTETVYVEPGVQD
jgi:hypothetical protein